MNMNEVLWSHYAIIQYGQTSCPPDLISGRRDDGHMMEAIVKLFKLNLEHANRLLSKRKALIMPNGLQIRNKL